MSAGFKRKQRNAAEEVAEFKSKKGFTQKGVDDLVMLPKITEPDIVDNLKKRYDYDAIYTNIGPVLIVVNPYKDLGLTTPDYVRLYRGKFRHELPPHIFALAEESYRAMKNEHTDQCCIISGESGAGKTVAAKQIMQYIAQVSGGNEKVEYVKSVILDSNPLLEAFGNAKTLRNNNSSRFGKYMEIYFDNKGDPIGGSVTNYLLEKSRVVYQQPGERNYHIFYQLIFGADQRMQQQYQLYSPENFHYMNQSNCYNVDDIDDPRDFADTVKAMNTIGISQQEQDAIFAIVSGILHVGNICFVENQKGNAGIRDRQAVELASAMLQVHPQQLEQCLLFKHMQSGFGQRTEVFESPMNVDQAVGTRDAIARDLYDRVFNYLIYKVNQALQRWNIPKTCTIGILDIFGFEIFDRNGFEQFCINYVNEKLQQYFIEKTLKEEQEEYVAEGIQWTPIKFFNNKIVCDLIEGKAPPGIFLLLDDICATLHAVSQGSDDKFLQKVSAIHGSHQHYQAFNGAFRVVHYAGDVVYTVDGFCDKNKDTLFQECIDCLRNSGHPFIRSLYPVTPEEEAARSGQKKRPTTAGFKIKNSANLLMQTLSTCEPHYIRCIKPNDNKRAQDWNADRVRHQVKYLGLLENVKVRRAGFAYRQPFERFLARYKKLSTKTWGSWGEWTGDPRQGCQTILQDLPEVEASQWQFGRTKLFIRHPETVFHIEELMERHDFDCIVKIQRAWRMFNHKRKMLESRAEAAQMLLNKKERRRDSLTDKWVGDYINYEENYELQKVMDPYKAELVCFADTCMVLTKKGRVEKRFIILTETAFYFVGNLIIKKQPVIQVTRRVQLSEISSITLSCLADGYVVVNTNTHEAVFELNRKTEFIMLLNSSLKETGKRPVGVNFSNNIQYRAKEGDKQRTLNFTISANPISLSEQQEKFGYKMKGIMGGPSKIDITVAKGLPSSTNSTPEGYSAGGSRGGGYASSAGSFQQPRGGGGGGGYQQQQQYQQQQNYNQQRGGGGGGYQQQQQYQQQQNYNQPRGGGGGRALPQANAGPRKPSCKALYDYSAGSQSELSFRAGDIITVLRKDPGGWWEGELQGRRGWIPANYVQEM